MTSALIKWNEMPGGQGVGWPVKEDLTAKGPLELNDTRHQMIHHRNWLVLGLHLPEDYVVTPPFFLFHSTQNWAPLLCFSQKVPSLIILQLLVKNNIKKLWRLFFLGHSNLKSRHFITFLGHSMGRVPGKMWCWGSLRESTGKWF